MERGRGRRKWRWGTGGGEERGGGGRENSGDMQRPILPLPNLQVSTDQSMYVKQLLNDGERTTSEEQAKKSTELTMGKG